MSFAGSLIVTAIACSAGDFIWQAATDHAWGTAFERSWLQFAALMIFAIVYNGSRRRLR